MLLSSDVHYGEGKVITAAVGFASWSDETSALELLARSDLAPAAYEPGAFFKRELPYVLSVIRLVEQVHPLEAVIVDGHVWLDVGKPGLGAHLHEALGAHCPVIGVAKTAFRGGAAVPVLRGQSQLPLFVTAAGMSLAQAAEGVRGMHGVYRIPTLLKLTDRLARGNVGLDPSKALAIRA